MKQLKVYQEKAVKQLITASKMFFDTDENETIVFQSPTGSGKTFMISNYISDIIQETELDLCFLWVSVGSGNLHEQSYKSVKSTVSPSVECCLVEKEFFGTRKQINRNEIVFINWEKIRSKDHNTGEYNNIVMTDKDTINFIEVLKNTRNINRKIILIIDESHTSANTQRAKELRDEVIKPFLTIEMSATPVLTDDMQMKVLVDPTKVIEEGMIKKEVIINKDIENVSDNESFSEELILECAFKKREELKKLYEQNNSDINPLVLIQLPNSDLGEYKKKVTLEFLKKKGILESDNKIAIWLSEEKVNNESDLLTPNDSTIDFLLFKQAVDTGWDCPRAQILVKFRETSSIVFEIQTVGRILRMPEAKHYMSDDLNTAYVYTNIKSIEIKKEIYNPNIIKSLCSKRNTNYGNLKLRSYYKNRVDFGDITSEYTMFFENTFCRYFKLQCEENTIPNYEECLNKMIEKGIKLDDGGLDNIITNVKIDSKSIDKGLKISDAEILSVKLSPEDLDLRYHAIINKNLNGFAPKRSIPKIKSAVLSIFRKYFNIKPANDGIITIQNIVVRNEEIFAKIISDAVDDYKVYHKKDVEMKSTERFNDEWEIPLSKNYNPETNVKIESALSLYQPLYMPNDKNNKVDELELSFIKHLENHPKNIEWFWKNGDEHMESNFGIKKSDGYTFQPDFIIKFKDGTIGIFDTKAIGHNENDHEPKSNALYKYISDERFNGKNIIGGLIVQPKPGEFKFYQEALYNSYIDKPDMWKSFDILL